VFTPAFYSTSTVPVHCKYPYPGYFLGLPGAKLRLAGWSFRDSHFSLALLIVRAPTVHTACCGAANTCLSKIHRLGVYWYSSTVPWETLEVNYHGFTRQRMRVS